MSDSIFDITPSPNDGETPWFKGGEAPGQPGVFKRIYYTADGWTFPSYCWWDGEKWFTGADKPEKAQDSPMQASCYQPFYRDGFDFAWCGLIPVEMAPAPEIAISDTPITADADAHREEQLDLPLEETDDNAAFFEA